jgi:hypothetical protein
MLITVTAGSDTPYRTTWAAFVGANRDALADYANPSAWERGTREALRAGRAVAMGGGAAPLVIIERAI